MKKAIPFFISAFLLFSCQKTNSVIPDDRSSMYFPPDTGSEWEKISPAQLGWKTAALEDLKNYLSEKNTKAFLILVNGRIAVESYLNGHSEHSEWEWNSAGKTLVAATAGIAQQEGYFQLEDKVSDFLGAGWTNMPKQKEDLIKIRHLLSMTSGIDESSQIVSQPNLTYKADAGTRWAYHNVFQKLMPVITNATDEDFELYFNEKLKNKIGMDGFWNFGLIFNIYHSTARSMARFGLLELNKGKWKTEQIVNQNFFNLSINSSQSINPSYGFLTWLNGKSKYMIPNSQIVFAGSLIPNAPADMFAAMGASDQRIYIVPSKNMVIVRMGESSDPANPTFAVSGFDSELWSKLNAIW